MDSNILIQLLELNDSEFYLYWDEEEKLLGTLPFFYLLPSNLNNWFFCTGLTDGSTASYTKICTLDDRSKLLNCASSIVESKWRSVNSSSASSNSTFLFRDSFAHLRIASANDNESVIKYATKNSLILKRSELKDSIPLLLSALYNENKRLKSAEEVKRKKREAVITVSPFTWQYWLAKSGK